MECPDCAKQQGFWTCTTCDGTRVVDPLQDVATIKASVSATILALMVIFQKLEAAGVVEITTVDLQYMMAKALEDLDAKEQNVWGSVYPTIAKALRECKGVGAIQFRDSTDYLAGLYSGAAVLASAVEDGEALATRLRVRAEHISCSRSVVPKLDKYLDDLIDFVTKGGDAS